MTCKMNSKDDYKEQTKKVFEKLDIKKAYAYADGTVKIIYNDGTEEDMLEVDWLKLYFETLKDFEKVNYSTKQEQLERFFEDSEDK